MNKGIWRGCAVTLMTLLVVGLPVSECRDVTNEDIRDAILSLVHMFRTSEDKLERHEFREKALGEQLKKTLSALDKKLRGSISRLDERLANVETILMQREERDKKAQEQTAESLGRILLAVSKDTSSSATPSDNLTTNEGDEVIKKLRESEAKIDVIKEDVNGLKQIFTNKESLSALCGQVSNGEKIAEAAKLLTKYEIILNEYNVSASRVPTDFVPLSEVAVSDEAWHSKMSEVMERQEKEVLKIQKLLSEAEPIWKALPKLNDVDDATNRTLSAINDARYTILSSGQTENAKLATKLQEMNDKTTSTNEDIQKSLTDGNTMTERLYNDVSRSYEQLHTEVQTLSQVEKVMLQTSDNVMDTKKRIEYSVHQIVLEVGDLFKSKGAALNKTINERFDTIQTSIIENQNRVFTNLSSKFEEDMSQLWRQIGTMYKQLITSTTSLEKLQKQTEQYVNGSALTMDSMDNKVGQITSLMSKVDENLNFLLGRLSLVTTQFNTMKKELGDALDSIQTSFVAAKTKLKDAGPGPHQINSAEQASEPQIDARFAASTPTE